MAAKKKDVPAQADVPAGFTRIELTAGQLPAIIKALADVSELKLDSLVTYRLSCIFQFLSIPFGPFELQRSALAEKHGAKRNGTGVPPENIQAFLDEIKPVAEEKVYVVCVISPLSLLKGKELPKSFFDACSMFFTE